MVTFTFLKNWKADISNIMLLTPLNKKNKYVTKCNRHPGIDIEKPFKNIPVLTRVFKVKAVSIFEKFSLYRQVITYKLSYFVLIFLFPGTIFIENL
jgi:hypothetical protein